MRLSVASFQCLPETTGAATQINAFIARAKSLLVKYVTLQPYLSIESSASCELVSAKGALVDQDLKPHSLQIDVDPIKLTARKWIAQRFESNDPSGQTPIVFVSGPGRSRFLQRQPACLGTSLTDM